MERKLNILKSFFEEPSRSFSIRELARILKINHTTIRQHLNKLVQKELLTNKKQGIYSFYKLLINKKTLNLKLYYNLEKIRKSKIIEKLEKEYDFPIIILFGSYFNAKDTTSSDVDLCLISNIKKETKLDKYEKKLNRKISIHSLTKSQLENMKKTNPEFINNICNGIVLSGELEVV